MAHTAKTKPKAGDFLLERGSFVERHLRGTVVDRMVNYFFDSILYSTLFGRQGIATPGSSLTGKPHNWTPSADSPGVIVSLL